MFADAFTLTFPDEVISAPSATDAETSLFKTSTIIEPPTPAVPDAATVPPRLFKSVVSLAITSTPLDFEIIPPTDAIVLLTITFAPIFAAAARVPVDTETAAGIMSIFS